MVESGAVLPTMPSVFIPRSQGWLSLAEAHQAFSDFLEA